MSNITERRFKKEKKKVIMQPESKDLRDKNQPKLTEITIKGSAPELLI